MAIVISFSMLYAKCSTNFSAKSPHVCIPIGRCGNHSSYYPIRLCGNSLIRYVCSCAMSMQDVEKYLTCLVGFPLPLYLGKLGMTNPCGKEGMYRLLSNGYGHKSFVDKVLFFTTFMFSIYCCKEII